MIKEEEIYTLFPDIVSKLTVMSKWDAMLDDSRNPESDFAERIEEFLKLGKRYKVTIIFEEIGDAE